MKISIQPGMIALEGSLDESADLSPMLTELQKHSKQDIISIDFSKLTRANSSGTFSWIRVMNQSGTRLRYLNMPVWLVEQFNLITDYFQNQSFAESFYAPFIGAKSKTNREIKLTVGVDFPLSKDYSQFKMPTIQIDGESFEMDFEPGRYFLCISSHFDNYPASYHKTTKSK